MNEVKNFSCLSMTLLVAFVLAFEASGEGVPFQNMTSTGIDYAAANVLGLLRSGWGVPTTNAAEQFAGWVGVPFAVGSGQPTEGARWKPLPNGQYVTPAALGYTVLAELALAENELQKNPAQTRMLAALAAEALRWSTAHLLDGATGLYRWRWQPQALARTSSPQFYPADQIAMLWAWSAWILFRADHPDWVGGLADAQQQADALFDATMNSPSFAAIVRPTGIYPPKLSALNPRDEGRLLQALAQYALATADATRRTAALKRLRASALDLVNAVDYQGRVQLQPLVLRGKRHGQLVSQAAVIAGLVAAASTSPEPFASFFQRVARGGFDYLQTLWKDDLSIFAPAEDAESFDYPVGTSGEVFGAFSAIANGQPDEKFVRVLEAQLQNFFQTVIVSDDVNGERSRLFLKTLAYDAQNGLQVMNANFNTAGAMYVAFNLIKLGKAARPVDLRALETPAPTTAELLDMIVDLNESVRYLLTQTARQDRSLGNAALYGQSTRQRTESFSTTLEQLRLELESSRAQIQLLLGVFAALVLLSLIAWSWQRWKRGKYK